MLSATPSCATALAICATHTPMTICLMATCGGGPACASTDILRASCLLEDFRHSTCERLVRIVAGVVILQRKLIVEDHAAAMDDGGVGEARLTAESAAVELAVEFDHRVGRWRNLETLTGDQPLQLLDECRITRRASLHCHRIHAGKLPARVVDRSAVPRRVALRVLVRVDRPRLHRRGRWCGRFGFFRFRRLRRRRRDPPRARLPLWRALTVSVLAPCAAQG